MRLFRCKISNINLLLIIFSFQLRQVLGHAAGHPEEVSDWFYMPMVTSNTNFKVLTTELKKSNIQGNGPIVDPRKHDQVPVAALVGAPGTVARIKGTLEETGDQIWNVGEGTHSHWNTGNIQCDPT